LESGFTLDEIKTMFFESDEGKDASFNNSVRGKIIVVYGLIFDDRQPDYSEVDHYHKMIIDGFVLFPDWIDNILSWNQAYKISTDEAINAIKFLYNEGIIFPYDRPSNEEPVE